MDKNKNQGNYKKQQGCNGCNDKKPVQNPSRVEIHLPELPDEDDFVTISLDEYTELVAIATTMDIVERWVKSKNAITGGKFNDLLLLLGVEDDK